MDKLLIKNKYALIFVILLFLTLLTGINSSSRESIEIEIMYETMDNGVMQLFYENKETQYPFDEINSQRRPLNTNSSSKTKIAFQIPYKGINQLRIDLEGEIKQISLQKLVIKKMGIPLKTYESSTLETKIKEHHDIMLETESNLKVTGVDPYVIYNGLYNQQIEIGLWSINIILAGIFTMMIYFVLSKSIDTKYIKYLISNAKEITTILMFLGFLALPSISFNFFNLGTIATNENRVLSKAPLLNYKTLMTYPREFENYYNDNLPYKNVFTRINSYIKYKIFDMSPAQYVVKGKENWLFYNSKYKNDVDTIADYMGTNLYTQDELNIIKEKLEEKQKYLKEKGIEFYVMIAPNKSQVYESYMPDSYQKVSEKSKTDYLVEYLEKNTTIPIIYPKEELIKEAEKNDVYYKLDTHWNNVGAYIGFSELMTTMNRSIPKPLSQLKMDKEMIKTGDLANMINMTGLLEDTKYIIEEYKPNIQAELVWQEDGEKLLGYKSTNLNGLKLVMYRDSFSTAMIPYLNKEYEESLFIWDHTFNKQLIEQQNPDVVVIELVERYVDTLMN